MQVPEQNLTWQSALLIRVHEPVIDPHYPGLSVKRLHLAAHPAGILAAGWDVPLAERQYPRVQLAGWKPDRDVPFTLPVQFHRGGDPRVAGLIASGTWVLAYDEDLYQVYTTFARYSKIVLQTIGKHPDAETTLALVHQINTTLLQHVKAD